MQRQGRVGGTVIERMIAALRLDAAVYAEVSADRAASGQALLVVLLSGVCTGVGLARNANTFGMWAGIFTAIMGWFLWTGVILAVAGVLRHRRDGRSLLRALGFANAPGVLLVLVTVPALARIVRVVVVLWMLAASAAALRAVYSVTPRRAWLITLTAFVVYLLLGIVSAVIANSA